MPKREDWLKRTDRGTMARPEVLFLGPNARTHIDPDELSTLEIQIREEGVLEQLLVRRLKGDDGGELQVWDGQRRLLCIRKIREEGHPIEWVPVKISRASEAELMLMAAMTQAGKIKLDPVDEARQVKMLLGYGMEVSAISERLGLSEGWVRQRDVLSGLSPVSQVALRAQEITLGKALQLADKTHDQQVAEIARVRERRERGEKGAGSVARPPGKRLIGALRDDIQKAISGQLELSQRPYTGEDLVAVLDWAAGVGAEDDIRARLGL